MPRLTRRKVVALLGTGATGILCARAGAAPSPPAHADIEALAERLRRASRDRAREVAVETIRAGADRTMLLGAVFLCGVRDIRPRPHGILHAVMMVEASFQLSEASPPGETWLPVLWNLDDLKSAQEADVVEAGDWKLAPPRPRRHVTAEAARREFTAAMDAWDPGRADRALVDLLPYESHDTFFEILWPFACRCSAFIGHKMIHTVQTERVLRRIGWAHAEPALRTLVMTLLVDRQTNDIERARDLAAAFPPKWPQGAEDPGRSARILALLRGSAPAEAQSAVAQAFRDGLGPSTVWDGMSLLGSEVFLRRPGRTASAGRAALLPVHAFTVTSAFRHAWNATGSDVTRRLLVLQAAAWLARVRDAQIEIVDLSMAGPGIETLGDAVTSPPGGDVPLDADPAMLRTWLDGGGMARSSSYLAGLRGRLHRSAQEHHQVKYVAAMTEESRRVAPLWASRILAPAAEYAANPADPDTEVYRRSMAALKRAGLA